MIIVVVVVSSSSSEALCSVTQPEVYGSQFNLSFTFQADARVHQEQQQPEDDGEQEQVNDAIQQRAVRHGDPLQERGAG